MEPAWWLSGKASACQCRRHRFDPWVRKIPWNRGTHSSILAWEIPWREEPGGLQSIKVKVSVSHSCPIPCDPMGSRHAGLIIMACGLSRFCSQALERRFRSWSTGLDALRHVESSQTKDWTHVSCIGRQMLYHWATREAWVHVFDIFCLLTDGLTYILINTNTQVYTELNIMQNRT